jgi:FkbM family methyltransferase
MRNNIGYWLRTEPTESVMPTLDKCLLPVLKIGYLSVRILLRLCLGKSRRDRMQFYRRLYVGDHTIPSYDITKFYYKSMTYLKIGTPALLKVHAKEHHYKYYSRWEDFKPGREEDIIKLFRPKEGDTVIDVGAHIGKYTIIASKMVGPNGKVIAIEAHPGNYEILKKNIALNNLGNVIALNYAVHSRKTIYNTIMADRTTSNNQNYVEVKADTLDTLLSENGIKEINWIKIDVEGAEYEVLKGASNILSNSKDNACLIEVHNLGHQNKNFYEQIIQYLGSKNYQIVFEKTYGSGERHIIMKRS